MIDLMDQMGTTPLEARQNSLLYTFIAIAIVILLALTALYIVLRYLGKLHSSKKWIEAHKNKETTKKNVAAFGKIANLTDSEQQLLWLICHENHTKNIEYLYMETDTINALFHKQYQTFLSTDNQDRIATLFSLRYKIEKQVSQRSSISSARALQEGQELLYIDKNNARWMFTLAKKDDKGFYLKMPSMIMSQGLQPEQLSKIRLNATLKNDMHYALFTRIIRYEKTKEGADYMVVSPSMTLKGEVRRLTKRITWETPCKFSAVHTTIKNGKTSFDVQEKKYNGIIQDISAQGCCLASGLPIKKDQYISVNYSLTDGTQVDAIGLIVATKRSSDGKYYILHIKFEKIPKKTQNRIYAFVYGYNKPLDENSDEETNSANALQKSGVEVLEEL